LWAIWVKYSKSIWTQVSTQKYVCTLSTPIISGNFGWFKRFLKVFFRQKKKNVNHVIIAIYVYNYAYINKIVITYLFRNFHVPNGKHVLYVSMWVSM